MFYCGQAYNKNITSPTNINGHVHIDCKTLRHVIISSVEAEVAGLFYNCQAILYIFEKY